MADFKLSHTAEEVDELLNRVKNGGSGAGIYNVKLTTTMRNYRTNENDDLTFILTTEESAALEVALESGLPVMIEAPVNNGEYTITVAAVAYVIKGPGFSGFGVYVSHDVVLAPAFDGSGLWMVQVQM